MTYAVLLSSMAQGDISGRYILSRGPGVNLEVQPAQVAGRELDSQCGERAARLGEEPRADQRERRERLAEDVRERDLDREHASLAGQQPRALEPAEVVVAVPAADLLGVPGAAGHEEA